MLALIDQVAGTQEPSLITELLAMHREGSALNMQCQKIEIYMASVAVDADIVRMKKILLLAEYKMAGKMREFETEILAVRLGVAKLRAWAKAKKRIFVTHLGILVTMSMEDL
jgi:hypothetical protein